MRSWRIELAAEASAIRRCACCTFRLPEDAATLSEPLGPNTRFLAKLFLPGDLTRACFSMLEQRADSRA
jgi:hypothetical protein